MRSALVWVLVVVGCGDNAIGNHAPVVAGGAVTTPEDTPLIFTINATDLEADAIELRLSNPDHGTVALDGNQVTYTPLPNYHGTDSLLVTASDGFADANATIDITVTSVNDAPVGNADSIAANEDTAATVALAALLMNDTDIDNDTLTITDVGNATHGAVAIDGANARFTPALDYNGPAKFEYVVSDGTTSVTVQVNVAVAVANDPPVATDDTVDATEDTPLTFAATTLVANDTDPDTQTLSVMAVANASIGTVALDSGMITFTPGANFNGSATFEYTVSDGAAQDTGIVTVAVASVNDAPVAVDDTGSVLSPASLVIQRATLVANDTDVDVPTTLAIDSVQNAVNGTVTLEAETVTFTATPGFAGTATFEYVVTDGTDTDVGLVTIEVDLGAVCGDGLIVAPETCDDNNISPGDGCSATCRVETGYDCDGEPSTCAPVCGDGITIAPETCDDNNTVNDDGCTSACRVGAVCTAAALPGGDRFAVDPLTGHCYAAFDDDTQTFAQAEAACVASGGHLVTITSSGEDALVHAVQNPAQNPWIGASEDGVDNDAVFDWVTDEAFGFTHFAAGQPDDDAGDGGNGECLHLFNADSEWNDTNCDISTFVVGRVCEIETAPCGDSILQVAQGEECDDGNTTGGDNCSATCQLEVGCGNGTVDAGEECDDDNPVGGDGCSATCQRETGCGNGSPDPGEECDDDNLADGDGCSATCLTEPQSISITLGPLTIEQQQRVQLKAFGTFAGGVVREVTATATWASTVPAIATVGTGGAANGRVDGQITAPGSTTISARIGAISGTTTVAVNAATCSMKINEIQVAGDGAQNNADEFAELVNPCTFPIDMTGWTLVYRSAAGTSDIPTTTVNLSGVVQPGEFRLYAGVGYNGGGTVDGIIGSNTQGHYAAAGGGMAIRAGAQNVGTVVDSIGYGTSTNAYIEGTVIPAPPANRSLGRVLFDGRDTNNSSTDFVVTDTAATPPTAPTPRATNFP